MPKYLSLSYTVHEASPTIEWHHAESAQEVYDSLAESSAEALDIVVLTMREANALVAQIQKQEGEDNASYHNFC